VPALVNGLLDLGEDSEMVGTPLVRKRLPAVEPEPCREVGLQSLTLAAHLGRRVFVLLDTRNLAPGFDVPLPPGVG
jgi:hypothetical protein